MDSCKTFSARFVRGALLLVTLSTVASLACRRDNPLASRQDPNKPLVAFIGPPDTLAESAFVLRGAEREAGPMHELTLRVHRVASESPEDLLAATRAALATSPKAVCLFVYNPAAALVAAREIAAAGVQLITCGARINDIEVFGHVDGSYSRGAEILGESLSMVLGDGKSYLLVHERGADPLRTQLYERFQFGARFLPGVTLLEEWNAFEHGLPLRESIRAASDKFESAAIIVTLSAEPWVGGAAILPPDRSTRFATLSASPALWPYLRNGKAAALVGRLDPRVGAEAVQLSRLALDPDNPKGGTRVIESELVTPGKLDAFAARYAAAAGLTVDELPGTSVAKPADTRPAATSPAVQP